MYLYDCDVIINLLINYLMKKNESISFAFRMLAFNRLSWEDRAHEVVGNSIKTSIFSIKNDQVMKFYLIFYFQKLLPFSAVEEMHLQWVLCINYNFMEKKRSQIVRLRSSSPKMAVITSYKSDLSLVYDTIHTTAKNNTERTSTPVFDELKEAGSEKNATRVFIWQEHFTAELLTSC